MLSQLLALLFITLHIPHDLNHPSGDAEPSRADVKTIQRLVAVGLPIVLAHPVFAADGNVSQVEGFIRSIIKVVAGLAGLVATGFFVMGGFTFITSSGNPERLDKAKQTLIWPGIGLPCMSPSS